MSNSADNVDWSLLKQLRRTFLDGRAGKADYWDSEVTLEHYDTTFAQRIGWKWDHVLADLAALGWSPPAGNWLDWGCGSGIAGRSVVARFQAAESSTLWLSDRSELATRFALARAKMGCPQLNIETGQPGTTNLLLLSHVLTELEPQQIEELLERVAKAETVIWVEPGTYEASLTLIAIRERLRSDFKVVAPCPHQCRCGILAPENERHWCHFFASPPAAVFTDAFWTRFGRELEIDLRSLPLSYLVLDKRDWTSPAADTARVLGRANLFKPHAEVLACSASGVRAVEVMKRTHGDIYRKLKKGRSPDRVRLETEGCRVTRWAEL